MNKRSGATYLLSISLFCLAGAIVYFTMEMTRVTQQIPNILDSIETTSKKIEPVVKEVSQIREQIPSILEEVKLVREQIPPILIEVEKTREQIPSILEEVKQVREQIPPTLAEVEKIRKQISPILNEVGLVRKQIPSILAEVKQVREQIPPIVEEVRSTRPVVIKAIDEVANTRKAIPPMLVQADKITSDMRQIGQKTSEGAVTGLFTGILKAPFNIVGGISGAIFDPGKQETQQLTQKDHSLMLEVINELVSTNKIGVSRNWSNPQSGNDGKITFRERKVIDKKECTVLHFVINIEGKKLTNKDVTLCLNDKSEWEVLK